MLNLVFDVVNLMGAIYAMTQKMKGNNEELKTLLTRISLLQCILDQITNIETSVGTDKVLESVKETLELIFASIKEIVEKNIIFKVTLSKSYEKDIEGYQTKLDQLTIQLNLAFQIDNRTEQSKGNKMMEAKLLEILSKMGNMEVNQMKKVVQQELPEDVKKGYQESEELGKEVTTNMATLATLQEKVLQKDTGFKIDFISFKQLELSEDTCGKGSYGVVYLGQWQGIHVAIKKINNVPFMDLEESTVNTDSLQISKTALREIKAFEVLQKSPYIVKFYGITSMDGMLGIVMDYVSNNSLFYWIYQDEDHFVDEELMKNIASKIARALSFMHDKKIAHNDIKSNNVMMDELFIPKLIDLGTVKLADSVLMASSKKSFQNAGAIRWKSPENLQVSMKNAKLQKEFPFAGDCYSYSILLGEMFAKELPFSMFDNDDDVKKGVVEGERPYSLDMHSQIPIPIFELMEKCWIAQPTERATMKSVVTYWESIIVAKPKGKKKGSTIVPDKSSGESSRELKSMSPLLTALPATDKSKSSQPVSRPTSSVPGIFSNDFFGDNLDSFISGKTKSLAFLKENNVEEALALLSNSKSPNAVEVLKYICDSFQSATAMFLLGSWYNKGEHGLNVDCAVASEWYRKSSGLNHSPAMNSLGLLYRKGDGVSADNKTAFTWFEKGAKQGNAESMRNLALLYEAGSGCEKSLVKALSFFEQSSSLGNVAATQNLFTLYMTEKDHDKAFKCCQSLIDAKIINDKYFYAMGMFYKMGLVVPIDIEKSKFFFGKAADLGNELAKVEFDKKLTKTVSKAMLTIKRNSSEKS